MRTRNFFSFASILPSAKSMALSQRASSASILPSAMTFSSMALKNRRSKPAFTSSLRAFAFLGRVAQFDQELDLLLVDLAVGPQLFFENFHLLIIDLSVRQRQGDGEFLPVGHGCSLLQVIEEGQRRP